MELLQHRQTIAPQGLGVLRLPVSNSLVFSCPSKFTQSTKYELVSPYFQPIDTRKVGTGRDIHISENIMSVVKAVVQAMVEGGDAISGMEGPCAEIIYIDATGAQVTTTYVEVDYSGLPTPAQVRNTIQTGALAYSSAHGFGLSASDILWAYNAPAMIPSPATRSIVTGTGATGFQVSPNHDARVGYSITIATTANISANASGTVVLEMAPTNSATPGDWVEISRCTNGQALTLAITLQSVQTMAGTLSGIVPAGYYAKLRSINNSGTPTYTYNSGQESLM